MGLVCDGEFFFFFFILFYFIFILFLFLLKSIFYFILLLFFNLTFSSLCSFSFSFFPSTERDEKHCCDTCDDVRNAYAERGWGLKGFYYDYSYFLFFIFYFLFFIFYF